MRVRDRARLVQGHHRRRRRGGRAGRGLAVRPAGRRGDLPAAGRRRRGHRGGAGRGRPRPRAGTRRWSAGRDRRRSPRAGWSCPARCTSSSWPARPGCPSWPCPTRSARTPRASASCSAARWTPGPAASCSGLGGSASTDGGTGALAALGARFLDAGQRELPRGGGALARLASADLAGLRPPPPGGAACLTDVRAPLLGPDGAAVVFGPQKGATAGAGDRAGTGPGPAGRRARRTAGQPGAGAAGGTGYGLAAAWGAELRPGSDEIARIAGLDAALAGAGLVITGEGRYDPTSGAGKVVGAVVAAASRAGVPAALVAGAIGGPRRAGHPPGRWRWPSWPGERPPPWPSPHAGCAQAGCGAGGLGRPVPARTPSLSTCER